MKIPIPSTSFGPIVSASCNLFITSFFVGVPLLLRSYLTWIPIFAVFWNAIIHCCVIYYCNNILFKRGVLHFKVKVSCPEKIQFALRNEAPVIKYFGSKPYIWSTCPKLQWANLDRHDVSLSEQATRHTVTCRRCLPVETVDIQNLFPYLKNSSKAVHGWDFPTNRVGGHPSPCCSLMAGLLHGISFLGS